jgi:hypothetical protein
MSDTIQKLVDAYDQWKIDDEKFVSGNTSAGTRARKALLEFSKLAKIRRAEISEERNARKGA